MNKKLEKWFTFKECGDERGLLTVVEAGVDIPFSIKRVYYIYDTKAGATRGYHAHRNLKQALVVLSGSCVVKLDDGETIEYIKLDDRTKGLYVGSWIWREMSDFSDDCILMCFANDYYKESDYIRDYTEFTDLISRRKAL